MQTLIHILTAIAFAVHAVVGCCLHHVHMGADVSAVDSHHEESHCCHHHNHDQDASGHPAEDSQHDGPCDESSCAFQVEPLIRASEALLIVDCFTNISDDSTCLLIGVNRPCLCVPSFLTAFTHTDALSTRAVLQSWVV